MTWDRNTRAAQKDPRQNQRERQALFTTPDNALAQQLTGLNEQDHRPLSGNYFSIPSIYICIYSIYFCIHISIPISISVSRKL